VLLQGAEFVVALTHMRGPNDRRLAEQATGIDLILGGHDHDYFSQEVCITLQYFHRQLFLNHQENNNLEGLSILPSATE